MSEDLIDAYNEIQDVLNNLKMLGIGDNRSVVEHLKDALGSLDDMITEEMMDGTSQTD